VFKRIAEASLRHLGIGPTVNPLSPVLVARHDSQPDEMTAHPVRAPTTAERAPAQTPDGEMPDLRGLSAREALRTLTRIGLTARMSGDGFVRQQWPEAGAVLGRDDACVLTLGRHTVVRAGGTQQ